MKHGHSRTAPIQCGGRLLLGFAPHEVHTRALLRKGGYWRKAIIRQRSAKPNELSYAARALMVAD
jgi:hypothetical protein